MTDLPTPIRDFINSLTEDTRSPAFLLVDEEDGLSEWGGDLESYGITGLQKNMNVTEHIFFLTGLLPLDTNSAFLPNVQLTEGVFADVYVFRRDQGTWVLFLDATAGAVKRQSMQQRTYDLGLEVYDLERKGESLGEVNTLLEQRVREQTAELSLTVRRLQQELAEGRRTEQELRRSESRFRSLYDSAMIGIMFCDLDGKITGANNAFLELLGYSGADLDLGIVEWSRIIGLGMQGLDERSRAELHDAVICGPIEREFVRKDGSRVTLLFGTGPLEGSNDKIVGFAVDLSQHTPPHP